MVDGIVRITGAGTFIPQMILNGSSETIQRDSYFEMIPIGSNTVTSSGNWA